MSERTFAKNTIAKFKTDPFFVRRSTRQPQSSGYVGLELTKQTKPHTVSGTKAENQVHPRKEILGTPNY